MTASLVILLLTALPAAYLLTAYLARPSALLRVLDHPNERSLHERAVPRTGGIAILLVLFSTWSGVAAALGSRPVLLWISGTALLVTAISVWDDFNHVSPLLRVTVHLIAALCLLIADVPPESLTLSGTSLGLSGFAVQVFCVLFVVWMINLYNFMDGMDGFAGGMSVFGFAAYAILGAMAQATVFSVLNAAIAVSALGFLKLNFPPARIFMGDAGSSTLGFLAAAMTLWAARDGFFSLWIGMLVFSPFIVDATVTVIRRAFSGDRIWRAHRSHYYQRLVQCGWGHRKTVLVEYALMAVCVAVAIVLARAPERVQGAGLILVAAAYAGLTVMVHEYTRNTSRLHT